ncbi:hypothetical protein IV203_013150 [Nitzschia inconspicua]|uniref:Uncharacterized protein n=1 Tax=Nitzschia inconspicua TaxID=303405 RepID=A0A9K3M6G1_9STRA|nr:hypothetical protein IV203_013150 [Nitzschia inconspicua]
MTLTQTTSPDHGKANNTTAVARIITRADYLDPPSSIQSRPKRKRKPAPNRNELVSVAIKIEKPPKTAHYVDPKKLAAIQRWKQDPNWTPLDWRNEYFHPTHPMYLEENEDNSDVIIHDMDPMFQEAVVPIMSEKYTNDLQRERERILQVTKLVHDKGYRYWQDKDGVQYLKKGAYDPTLAWRRHPKGYHARVETIPRLPKDHGFIKAAATTTEGVVPNGLFQTRRIGTCSTIRLSVSSADTAALKEGTRPTPHVKSTFEKLTMKTTRQARGIKNGLGDESKAMVEDDVIVSHPLPSDAVDDIVADRKWEDAMLSTRVSSDRRTSILSARTNPRNKQPISFCTTVPCNRQVPPKDQQEGLTPRLKLGDRVYIPSYGVGADFRPTKDWGIWGRIADSSKFGTAENVYQISLQESGYRVERAADVVFSYEEAKRNMKHPNGLFSDQEEPPSFTEDSPLLVVPNRKNNISTWPGLKRVLRKLEREEQAVEEERRAKMEAQNAKLSQQSDETTKEWTNNNEETKKKLGKQAKAVDTKKEKPVDPNELKELDFRKGTVVYALFSGDGLYYWAKITKRWWDDERCRWLYNVTYHDGDTATNLPVEDMYSMEETIRIQQMNPNSGIARLPTSWVPPFMTTEEKEELIKLWQYVYAARRQQRGSKPDCLEYDWAQIISRGKRNDLGKLVFKVRYADNTTGSVDCMMMRGMHEMMMFIESNEIRDEKQPPASWLMEMKKSKLAPENVLATVNEKESQFGVGTHVYAEYVDEQSIPCGYYWGTIIKQREESNGRVTYRVQFTDGDECEQTADNMHSFEEAEKLRRCGSEIPPPPNDEHGWHLSLHSCGQEAKPPTFSGRNGTLPTFKRKSESQIAISNYGYTMRQSTSKKARPTHTEI